MRRRRRKIEISKRILTYDESAYAGDTLAFSMTRIFPLADSANCGTVSDTRM